MNSIVWPLVQKDLKILKVPSIAWFSLGLVAILLAIADIGTELVPFIVFITAMYGAAIHPIMQTVVMERQDKVLAFVMSLPVSVRQYTTAKLIANLAVFTMVWGALSIAFLAVGFAGEGGIPDGAIPFATIILLTIFLAYTFILAVGLVGESVGFCTAAIGVASVSAHLFANWIVDHPGLAPYLSADNATWTSGAIQVLTLQVLLIVGLIVATYFLQARKQDFL